MAKFKNLVGLNHDFSSRSQNIETFNGLRFFTTETRLTFTKLREVFIEILIL